MKETMLQGLLIDPYQKMVHDVIVKNDIHDWHKMLDCDCLDIGHIGMYKGHPIDVWVDDSGLMRKPMPPLFRWLEYPNPLAGYGLVLSSDANGESISTNIPRSDTGRLIIFEDWERRMSPDIYFDQLSRVYPFRQTGTYGVGGGSYDTGRGS